MRERLRVAVERWLPLAVRERIRRWRGRWGLFRVPPGRVDFGSLRSLRPLSGAFGYDRGQPIDRYYIETFLAEHADDIRGDVLEIGDDAYTRRFGGEAVRNSDVLHVTSGNPGATLIADLTAADNIASERFDCIICTQTLQMILDVHAALGHLHRILKPGGVLLVTTHGISPIARREGIDEWGEYWRLTSQSARRLFGGFFGPKQIRVRTFGNVLTAVAFLHGLAVGELQPRELAHCDDRYEMLIGVRAQKYAPLR